MSGHPFFSPEWNALAKGAVNASDAMYKGFKDPASFTHKMEFACTDRPLAVHLEWEQGKVVSWSERTFDESELYLIITAPLEIWKQAAEGAAEGGTLLMAGNISFTKGPMSAAIENGGAFNNFLRSWGEVPTDWNV